VVFNNFHCVPKFSSKISFNLAAKLVAYNTMSAFRGNLGEVYIGYNVKTIHDLFFKEKALLRLNNREELEVTIFGHEHAEVLESMYSGLSEKLLGQGISPGVSWPNDYPLKFVFW